MFWEMLFEEGDEGFEFPLHGVRQGTETGGPGGRGFAFEKGDGLFAEVRQSLAAAGDQWDDGHAEFGGERLGIDLMSVLGGHIDHVQRDDAAMAEFDDLRCEVEIPFEIRGIDDDDHQVGRRDFIESLEENVPRDLFIERLWAEAVGAGQIEHTRLEMWRHPTQQAFLTFDGDTGVVADLGAKAGQGIEEGRFATVRVAGEHDHALNARGGERCDGSARRGFRDAALR
jgi:hypothetical protein